MCVLKGDSEAELIRQYYELVKEKQLSLEFTEDHYVYLIPKKHAKRSFRLAHKMPALPHYQKQEPIPFYAEKAESDARLEPTDELIKDSFFTSRFYKLYLEYCRYGALRGFVLTLGRYNHECIVNGTLKIDKDMIFNMCEIKEYCPEVVARGTYRVPNIQSYHYYVKPTFETDPMIPFSHFYTIYNKTEFMMIYWAFIDGFHKWLLDVD